MGFVPSVEDFAILLGLAFFLGFAFEDFYLRAGETRPGGIRTFPLLALGGGLLYALDPKLLLPFTAGLLAVGAWLFAYYRDHMGERDDEGRPNVSIVVPLLNLHAYLLGAVALALPHWVAVGTTVVAVLLFTGRARLHDLARARRDARDHHAGAIPDPDRPRPAAPAERARHHADLRSRRARPGSRCSRCARSPMSATCCSASLPAAGASSRWRSWAGSIPRRRRPWCWRGRARRARKPPASRRSGSCSRPASCICASSPSSRCSTWRWRRSRAAARRRFRPLRSRSRSSPIASSARWRRAGQSQASRNPLELGTAAIFAALFVGVSLLSAWVSTQYGRVGLDILAAVVGVSDINPFVLEPRPGRRPRRFRTARLAEAILIAIASNNVLVAIYALGLRRRAKTCRGRGRPPAAGRRGRRRRLRPVLNRPELADESSLQESLSRGAATHNFL